MENNLNSTAMAQKTEDLANNQNPSEVSGNIQNEATPQPPTISVVPALSNVAVRGQVPQAVSASQNYQLASLTKRSYATFIDGLIVSAVSILLNLPIYIQQFKYVIDNAQQEYVVQPLNLTNPVYYVLSFLSFAFSIAYYIYFIGKRGATPGKMLFKIKVIDKDTQQPPGYLKAFLREIVGKFISSLVLFIGYFLAIQDKEKQAWHDKIANTIVIVNTKEK